MAVISIHRWIFPGARKSNDLDELIDAHETYLQTVVRKSLLDEASEHLREVLYQLFEVTHRFSRLVERLHADIDAADHIESLQVKPPKTNTAPEATRESSDGLSLSLSPLDVVFACASGGHRLRFSVLKAL